MSPTHRILVVGAGIAGSTLAFWLAKNGFSVVVIERSPVDQTAGQGIDIDGPALEIVSMMGILEKIRARTTHEEGAAIYDEQDRPCAIFDLGGFSLTKSIEIMRGDLADILYKAADEFESVEFRYETSVQTLRQTGEKVFVELQHKCDNTTRTEEFDIVVGADGINSRTRQLTMGSPEQLNCLKPVGCFVAFFSIPSQDQDWPRARVCQFPGRRTVAIRPMGQHSKFSSAYITRCYDTDISLLEAHKSGNRQESKEAFAALFSGLGWETPRIVEQMLKMDNFYSDRLMQVKLKSWSQNRVVLLGDAAYAPSPLTGKGTLLAILGAFVLAQEVARRKSDDTHPSAAFDHYEKRMRRYVENAQCIPLGGYAPYVLNLKTSLGIWLFRKIAGFVSWSGVLKWLPEDKPEEFELEVDSEKVMESA